MGLFGSMTMSVGKDEKEKQVLIGVTSEKRVECEVMIKLKQIKGKNLLNYYLIPQSLWRTRLKRVCMTLYLGSKLCM